MEGPEIVTFNIFSDACDPGGKCCPLLSVKMSGDSLGFRVLGSRKENKEPASVLAIGGVTSPSTSYIKSLLRACFELGVRKIQLTMESAGFPFSSKEN